MRRYAASWLLPMLFLVLALASWGCGTGEAPAPDVSDVPADLMVRRFDQELFQLDTTRFAAALQELEVKYPAFSQLYFSQLLPARRGELDSLEQLAFIRGFITFPAARQIYERVSEQYPDTKDIEKELKQALRYFRYYFPAANAPDTLITFIADFAYGGVLYGDNQLAVGLDLFLEGYNYRQVDPQDPAFSAYLTRTYNRAHLVSKLIQNLVDDLVGPPTGNRMLDYMINNGKKLYIADKLQPATPDSIIMEVSGAQWDWLVENERSMWSYFLQEDLVYNTTWRDIRKYVDYSPNSLGMPDEAPGRTANYVGWLIVKQYMQRFPNLTLPDLLLERDAQRILEGSKYKPGR